MKHLHLNYLSPLAPFCLLVIALAGCTFLAPIPEKSRYFLLTPIAAGEHGTQINQQNTSTLVLGLGPVKFPDYLERSEMAERIAPNQVEFLQNDHWAEPLRDNFTHVLSENLTTLLGTQQIIYFPWYSSTHVDYQIAITVDRFECGTQGEGGLEARWSINNPVSGQLLEHRESDLKAPCGGEVDQGVAAMSRTLADLSRQIATAISQLAAAHHAE
jgi:uncharacterized lipoprotein YmbA